MVSGSSPLTRGKPHRSCSRRGCGGLIPAHAGKTTTLLGTLAASRAHPRSRGENAELMDRYTVQRGSSPLTRGKPKPMDRRPPSVGLIPAHAGKTTGSRAASRTQGAHPRSRGENGRAWRCRKPGGGSSPLTRGKPLETVVNWPRVGLIPAHAGKTVPMAASAACTRAHPRSRGENPKTRSNSLLDPGSSPLTRGKPAGYFVSTK